MRKVSGIVLIVTGVLLALPLSFQIPESIIRFINLFDPSITAYQRGEHIGYLFFEIILAVIVVALISFGKKLYKEKNSTDSQFYSSLHKNL